MMYQAILIQSAYHEESLSARRLELAHVTSIPSLASQTVKPFVHLELSHSDPNAHERLKAFQSTGCSVVVVWREDPQGWHLPSGRRLMHRLDDDDMISTDFCERTRTAAEGTTGDVAMIWPNGFVLCRRKLHPLTHHSNQFVALATDRVGWQPHLEHHHKYFSMHEWEKRIVSEDRAWCWVRHSDSLSKTRGIYIRHPAVTNTILHERFSEAVTLY